jgi:hypothetical protein
MAARHGNRLLRCRARQHQRTGVPCSGERAKTYLCGSGLRPRSIPHKNLWHRGHRPLPPAQRLPPAPCGSGLWPRSRRHPTTGRAAPPC